jgi:hypothetical protein
VAIDFHGNAYIYDGFAWTSTNIDGQTSLESVSCPSPTFCVAGDSLGRALFFDGFTWSTPQQAAPAVAGSDIGVISCASATFCAAGDGNGEVFVYNGSGWSAPYTLDPALPGLIVPSEGTVTGLS